MATQLISSTRGYIGKGGTYLVPRGTPQPPINPGNCKALNLKIETERKSRVDMQTEGGGELDVLERITSVSGEITIDDFKPEVLALALGGTAEQIAAAAVASEEHILYPSNRVFLQYIPDPSVALTVTIAEDGVWAGTTVVATGAKIVDGTHLYQATTGGTTSGTEPTWPTNGTTVNDGTVVWKDLGTTTLVLNTHYKLNRNGIESLPAATQFAGGTTVSIGYTKNPQWIIEALVNTGREYTLIFDGLNENDAGNPMPARAHRVKFSPTSGLDLISDDYGAITLSFSILKDETITGAGLSQFLQIGMI